MWSPWISAFLLGRRQVRFDSDRDHCQRVLASGPRVVQVVPLTRSRRGYACEVDTPADVGNGLTADSAGRCQHVRAVSTARVQSLLRNVGPAVLGQVRETLAVLLDQ